MSLKMTTQNSVIFITGANRGLGLAFPHGALRREFTNALRVELRNPNTLVLGLHVSFMREAAVLIVRSRCQHIQP